MGKFDNFVSLDLGQMANDDSRFGRGKRIQRLKVQVGKPLVVRILRGAADSTFYRVRSQHWGIPVGHGNTPPLSCARKHADEPCYFCEQVNEYYNSGDPRQNEMARRMKASVSVISNVIDVKDSVNEDGTPKVLIWQYSWKLFQEVRAYFRDEDYGDLTHPVTGRNFKISASVVSSSGDRKWTRYDLQVGARETELEVPEALNHLYDLDSTFPVKMYSYEEQQMIWDGSWDPRAGRAALPASAAEKAPKLESGTEESYGEKIFGISAKDKESDSDTPDSDDKSDTPASDDEFETSKAEADDEFETAEEDEWDDILSTDGASDKEKEMAKKLAALKKAAKK